MVIRHQREKIEGELTDARKNLLELLDRQLVPAMEDLEERHREVPSVLAPRMDTKITSRAV